MGNYVGFCLYGSVNLVEDSAVFLNSHNLALLELNPSRKYFSAGAKLDRIFVKGAPLQLPLRLTVLGSCFF